MTDWKSVSLGAAMAVGLFACAGNTSSSDDTSPDTDAVDAIQEEVSGHLTPDERFGAPPEFTGGTQEVDDPFLGVRVVQRAAEIPRPLSYYLVLVDPSAEGIDFTLTPSNGEEARETTRSTTLSFAEAAGTQVAFNAHFFRPWPAEDPYAELVGFGASDGDIYSLFEGAFDQALVTTSEGTVHIIEQVDDDETGAEFVPVVVVDDALGSNERILRDGVNTATWEELHPRTAVGVTEQGHLVGIVVDGRQDGFSEGMTTPEVADVLLEFGVTDAINLDGGGSSTLVVEGEDGEAKVLNSPVGFLFPGTERENGSSFGIYAQPLE